MVTSSLIQVGGLRGHDIKLSSVRPRRSSLHRRPDIVLLFDVFNHAHSYRSLGAWRRFDECWLEYQISRAPFVHLTTAYADVCNLPHLPCCGRPGPPCPAKPVQPWSRRILMRDFGVQCFAVRPLVKRLYAESALNVYLSPQHRRVSEHIVGLDPSRPSLVLGPMIDTRQFRKLGLDRDIENLFVGLICEAKGLDQMRAQFANRDIVLVGRLAQGARLDFGRHFDHVPYADIPKWMNRANNFVFLPRWPEPQGRVVAEAALCGCNIIGNGNVGVLSFGFDLADPGNYGHEEEKFWAAVEALV